MKTLFLCFFILVAQQLFAQKPFYDWIGHEAKEIISTYNEPKAITRQEQDSLYIYETELGYTSYLISNGFVKTVDNTTYWKKKSKAKDAIKELINMYKKDGFNVDETSDTITYLTKDIYLAKIRTFYQEGYYAASETVSKFMSGGK